MLILFASCPNEVGAFRTGAARGSPKIRNCGLVAAVATAILAGVIAN